jgi:hypothetical protein
LEAYPDAGYYRLVHVPDANSTFEGYEVVLDPQGALCKVIGIGGSIPVRADLGELLTTFQRASAELSAQWGVEGRMVIDSAAKSQGDSVAFDVAHRKVRFSTIWLAPYESDQGPDVAAALLRIEADSPSTVFLKLEARLSVLHGC